jgi:hypothetical protein
MFQTVSMVLLAHVYCYLSQLFGRYPINIILGKYVNKAKNHM